jgi:hypothetical protein
MASTAGAPGGFPAHAFNARMLIESSNCTRSVGFAHVRGNSAANYHRVGGKPAHPTGMP